MNQRRAARALGIVQAIVGFGTAAAPQRTARTLLPRGAAVPDTRIIRVLGLRQLAQGAVGMRWPQPQVVGLGALVDVTHAASLVPIIALSPRYRTAAGVSAAMATTAALVGWLTARSEPDVRDGHDVREHGAR